MQFALVCRAVGLTVTAPQPSQPLQTIYPADILAGWRAGPQDPAGDPVKRQLELLLFGHDHSH